jgi:hypothetical protein
VAAAPPPAARKNFLGRVVDVVTLKRLRDARHKSAETAKAAETKSAGGAGSTDPTVEEMTGRLAETMAVDDSDLGALAEARAQQVRDYFITTGKIDPERIFLAKEKADAAKAGKGPRVFLNLQ